MDIIEKNTVIACRPNKEISWLIKEIKHLRMSDVSTTQTVIDAFEYCDKNVVNYKNEVNHYNISSKLDIDEDEIKYLQLHIPELIVNKVRNKIKKDYELSVVQQRFMLKLVLKIFLNHLQKNEKGVSIDKISKNSWKLVSWNINQSCLLKYKEKKISDWVLNKLVDADIFVLTEVFNLKMHINYYKEKLTNFDLYFRNNDPIEYQNEVLIGVKKNEKIKAPTSDEFVKQEQLSIGQNFPNSLAVKLNINNNEICILGIRITVGKGTKEDYLDRTKQLCKALDFLKQEKAIIVGDFNNSRIKGEYNKSYFEVRENYHYTNNEGLSDLYDTYNYHIMKDIACARGFNIAELPDDYSHVVGKYKYKLDHLFSKGVALNPIPYMYQWDFMENNLAYEEFTCSDSLKSLWKLGVPDHAVLTGVFTL